MVKDVKRKYCWYVVQSFIILYRVKDYIAEELYSPID